MRSHRHRATLAWLLICAGAPALASAQVPAPAALDCPPAVRLEGGRVVAAAGQVDLAGWQGRIEAGSVRLSGVNVFEGPPADGAVLKPTTGSGGGRVSVWRFGGPDAGGRFLSCDYAEGLLRLHAPVPPGATSCTATLQRQRPQGTLSAGFVCR
ncbi:conserved exported hypothetical protein [Rubrivivax sp. A210]|uniref:STY0301 family protein n=1 Tax=Rubrivivax sp. A210 TaxID=2772301 RepID=UPI00191AC590|nr:STY0301 family protein [Rubrivivax sp. A210]CAD5374827.1 conserved exported hypothetical protein [Rubrivivax sp. A210]